MHVRRIVNLTSGVLRIYLPNQVEYEPNRGTLRALSDAVPVQDISSEGSVQVKEIIEQRGRVTVDGHNIPVFVRASVLIDGALPPPQEGTIYVVPGRVIGRVHGRGDVFSPGKPVHNSSGKTVGCLGLSCRGSGYVSDGVLIMTT